MCKTLKTRTRAWAVGTGAATAAVTLGGTLLVSPAEAAPARPYGTVVAQTGVNERQYPSTDSSVLGFLKYGSQVGLKCKVRAQNIGGNEIWYLLRDRATWVSAKYVDNTGFVKYCKDVQRNSLTHSTQAKTAKG
ncbi:SH3 domain-containing protein [Streptomyces sp. 8N706]|uniref:SH3 domain-containing protein n=1 Tax=Streptomyces sp. 8N706 TaxID=3457416 RepID=UPI003FD67A83